MIKSYSEVHSAIKRNLLLGNGFSVGVSSEFTYNSLIEVALSNRYLEASDKQLFEKFDTVNFETILHNLFITQKVNEILSVSSDIPSKKYNYIKEALIKSVNKIHPKFDEISTVWISSVISELKKYKEIYTTNYDLLLYWIMSKNDFKSFSDYFWSSGLCFDQFNTELWNSTIPVHYLHGALFIYFDDDLEIKKTRKTESNSLLEEVEKLIKVNKIPLFISEGTSKVKMNMIENNAYLNFVFNEFHNMKEGATIYGCAFEDSDQHIINSLNNSKTIQHIAISIYTENKNTDDINEEINKYKLKLNKFLRVTNNTLEFFDYKTSPFVYNI